MNFGFMLCRVMKHYGQSWQEIMRTPIKAFWLMLKNLPAVLAETDLREFDLLITAASGDKKAVTAVRDSLVKEIGSFGEDPIMDAEVDHAGLSELRFLGG